MSAQVQRTLVKSPPELWAELSDPAALARHLGELGEIRITRVEPEHKLEWAAEHASGTVQIKPSAWGTRVTLTAKREHRGDSPSSSADAPSEPTSLQPTSQPPAASGLPLGGERPSLETARPPASTSAAQSSTSAAPASARTEAVIAAEQNPATAREQKPERTPERESASGAQESSTPTSAGQAVAAERAPKQDSTEREPAGESRRGLFARLLRRFRREESAEACLPADDHPRREPPARPVPRSVASPASSTASERAEESPVSPSTDAREQPAADTSEPRVERQAPDLTAAGAARIAPTAALPEPTPVAVPVRQETAEPSHMEPQVSQPEDPTTPTAVTGQAPADDVAAVLTSVLDRLGAAHHRPFSRA